MKLGGGVSEAGGAISIALLVAAVTLLSEANAQPPASNVLVAKRGVLRPSATPPLASDVQLGDGWGCAKLHDASRYCWKSADHTRKPGGPIVAHHIPWLDDRSIHVGPDRICIGEAEGYRCWRAPKFIDSRGVWPETTGKPGQAESWHVPKSEHFLDSVPVTHGAWHGCSASWCWSSKTPPGNVKICRSGRFAAPCAVADEAALAKFGALVGVGSVMVGDLFACVRDIRDNGLRCIGASRDGFFGTSQECPAELLRAWPSSSGPTLAPKAKCSRTPVRVGTNPFHGNDAFAGPRGVCLESGIRGPGRGRLPCFGAIPLASRGWNPIVVGLGDDPSACGINRHGQVHCAGAGYSLDAARAQAVPIHFDVPTQGTFVSWDGKGPFHKKCGLFRNCARAAEALPSCPSNPLGTQAAELSALRERREGQEITVQGALVLANISSNWVGVSCGPFLADGMTPDVSRGGGDGDFCCLEAEAPIAIRDKGEQLVLEGTMCGGDLSRLCCNIPVLGQRVAATGKLSFRGFTRGVGHDVWVLSEPRLCEIASAPPSKEKASP